jgi:uncharacterized protein (TIGR03437 family)
MRIRLIVLALAACGVVFGQTSTITTFAGNGTGGYGGDNGSATNARLNYPSGVAFDAAGNLYIADIDNHRVRKVSNGIVTTVAGTGIEGYSGDNGPATGARLNYPHGLAFDSAGDLYIADMDNHRIRKVSNGIITTVAGSGTGGYGGDNGLATNARLNYPAGVAFDPAGNLFIVDIDNHRIRKVSGGIITTVAGTGTGGYGGDNGPATNARLNYPHGIAFDSAGNLHIADMDNHRIRKVSSGVITTVAGTGTGGYSGDNGPATNARLDYPVAVAFDSAGHLYLADIENHRIRKVSSGVITTVAGNGIEGYGGDNGPATGAQLNYPHDLAFDSAGNLYIADMDNHRIRKAAGVGPVRLATVSAASFTPSVPLAPGAIVAGYGTDLVATIEVAPGTGPLPTVLAQTSVKVRDGAGVERTTPLWFVSPNQINYYLAGETALGLATVTVVRNAQTVAAGTLQIELVAPGLFTMNNSGQGVPAALAIFARGDGSQTWQYVFNTGCQVGSCQPVPLDLGPATDQVYLQLYGTGIRGRASLAGVAATIGGVAAAVQYAGPVEGLTGLDQVNLLVPRTLIGRGPVDVILTVDGRIANAVQVNIR